MKTNTKAKKAKATAKFRKAKAEAKAKDASGRLLTLPREIRNYIYELAMPIPEHTEVEIPVSCPTWGEHEGPFVFKLDLKNHSYDLTDGKPLLQPSLTRTCRQIRSESLPIFYSGWVVHFEPPYFDPLTPSWSAIAPQYMCMMKHIFFTAGLRNRIPPPPGWTHHDIELAIIRESVDTCEHGNLAIIAEVQDPEISDTLPACEQSLINYHSRDDPENLIVHVTFPPLDSQRKASVTSHLARTDIRTARDAMAANVKADTAKKVSGEGYTSGTEGCRSR